MSNTKITEPQKQPPANFVHRDLTDEILHILNTYAGFIDEAIDFGCKILFWEPKEDHDGSPVSPMMLRQFIETLDGLGILVRNGASEIARSVLRSAFEINLYIHFLQEDPSQNRNYSFLVIGAIDRIKYLKKLNPNTSPGMQLSKDLFSEGVIADLNEKISIETVEKEIADQTAYLKKPEFIPIIEEYEKLVATKKGNIKWHSLFGGADSIKDLSKKLKKYTYYEILYKEWSGTVHGSQIFLNKMQQSAEGNLIYHSIRTPSGLCFLSKMACNIAINTFGHYVINRHPSQLEDYKKWEADYTRRYSAILDREHINIRRDIRQS